VPTGSCSNVACEACEGDAKTACTVCRDAAEQVADHSKHAIDLPLLKTSGLDAGDTRNYRPVSNLSFLSKLLERVAQRRLQAFLDSHDLMPTTRSVYRIAHSTESAVTAIYSDLLMRQPMADFCPLCLGFNCCL